MHPTPHNQLFESVFSDPAQATAYLKDVLPVPLVDGVDWGTLRKAPGSFVDESLRSRHSDLLFDVQLTDGRPLRVFFDITVPAIAPVLQRPLDGLAPASVHGQDLGPVAG